jgi:1-acyl-sn-glycerol-3-phosphate acyltransferase
VVPLFRIDCLKAILRNLRGVIVFAGLTLNTVVWFTPLFLLAIVKLLVPVPAFRRWLTGRLMWFGENWVAVNRLLLAGSGSMAWRAEGIDNLRPDGWYLVLANHQTWVDIVVLQTVFNRRIPFLKFFIKQELVWFPVLGAAWWALDMPFMKRYSPSYLARHPERKGRDLDATRKACEKFRHTPTSVINFVEGTRFSEAKRIARQSPYRHLLQPRAGGVAVALGSMGELFDSVLDVTIAYPDGVPEFWAMVCGERVRADVNVTVRELAPTLLAGDYQADREFRREVHHWLADIWRAKDDRLAAAIAGSQSPRPVA